MQIHQLFQKKKKGFTEHANQPPKLAERNFVYNKKVVTYKHHGKDTQGFSRHRTDNQYRRNIFAILSVIK